MEGGMEGCRRGWGVGGAGRDGGRERVEKGWRDGKGGWMEEGMTEIQGCGGRRDGEVDVGMERRMGVWGGLRWGWGDEGGGGKRDLGTEERMEGWGVQEGMAEGCGGRRDG